MNNRELLLAYKFSQSIFPNINKFCKKCNSCCWTYGWLLPEEKKKLSSKNIPIVKVNNVIFCIDSFIKDRKNKRIISEIPRCRIYKKRRCLINKDKPLDCRLYPVKVKYLEGRVLIGLSLGCDYIRSLTPKKIEIISNNVSRFFKKAPQKIVNEYLDLMFNVSQISKPKKFWMKELIEAKKDQTKWNLVPVKCVDKNYEIL